MWFILCNQAKGVRRLGHPNHVFQLQKGQSINFLKDLMQSPYNFNTNIHILKSKISYRLENQFRIPAMMLTNNKNIFQIKHALHNKWKL